MQGVRNESTENRLRLSVKERITAMYQRHWSVRSRGADSYGVDQAESTGVSHLRTGS